VEEERIDGVMFEVVVEVEGSLGVLCDGELYNQKVRKP